MKAITSKPIKRAKPNAMLHTQRMINAAVRVWEAGHDCRHSIKTFSYGSNTTSQDQT